MNRTTNKHIIPELKQVFAKGGTRAAVAFLNSLTDQRFTSLFRFDNEMLRNITFYDRERPETNSCEDIPVMASYCVFVRDSSTMFLTTDAQHDTRVNGHPKQSLFQSYCGVPLLDRHGNLMGTICHFDFNPGNVSALDIELMEYMAALLQPQL
jgi:GAF domain-containing protein